MIEDEDCFTELVIFMIEIDLVYDLDINANQYRPPYSEQAIYAAIVDWTQFKRFSRYFFTHGQFHFNFASVSNFPFS